MIEPNRFNDRDISELNEYVTIEKASFMKNFFPELVELFESMKAEKKIQKKSSNF